MSERELNWPQVGRNALLVAAWLWLFAPLAPYFYTVFSRQDFRTNQIVLVVILALWGHKVWGQRSAVVDGSEPVSGAILRLDGPLRWRALPLFLMVSCAVAYWMVDRWLDINVVAGMLFALGSYGLVGLWIDYGRWRRGLLVALLIAGTLPINGHLQTFVGYPLRLGTAVLVRDILISFGIGSVGVDTILVLENGLTHIAAACSGVQSLWTGGMFLLVATWLEEKRLGLRWLGIALVLIGGLVASNFARVFALVVTGSVWGIPLLADVLHAPLGILGFGGACGVALLLLRRLPKGAAVSFPAVPTLSYWVQIGLIVLCSGLALTYESTVRAAELQPAPARTFGAGWETTADPLEDEIRYWLERDGASSADRHRFTYRNIDSNASGVTIEPSGSMLFVASDNWQAHHNPERCFMGDGLSLVASETQLVDNDFPIRVLEMTTPSGERRTAVYWYQSAEQVTDDYATRIWADFSWPRQEWVLVTILFEDEVAWEDGIVQEIASDLYTLHE